jgi:hypothetical protein
MAESLFALSRSSSTIVFRREVCLRQKLGPSAPWAFRRAWPRHRPKTNATGCCHSEDWSREMPSSLPRGRVVRLREIMPLMAYWAEPDVFGGGGSETVPLS